MSVIKPFHLPTPCLTFKSNGKSGTYYTSTVRAGIDGKFPMVVSTEEGTFSRGSIDKNGCHYVRHAISTLTTSDLYIFAGDLPDTL